MSTQCRLRRAENRRSLDTESSLGVSQLPVGGGEAPFIPRATAPTTDRRPFLGARGERAAARYLCGLGWQSISRNARTRYGELDLICLTPDRILVFVEVKALRGRDRSSAERALESIGPRKQLQVRRLARAWLAENRPPGSYRAIRFDAVGVSIGRGGRASGLVHVPAAF